MLLWTKSSQGTYRSVSEPQGVNAVGIRGRPGQGNDGGGAEGHAPSRQQDGCGLRLEEEALACASAEEREEVGDGYLQVDGSRDLAVGQTADAPSDNDRMLNEINK